MTDYLRRRKKEPSKKIEMKLLEKQEETRGDIIMENKGKEIFKKLPKIITSTEKRLMKHTYIHMCTYSYLSLLGRVR